MQGKDVAFLGNHGVIVAGATVAHAYDDLYYLERACMHQVLAMSTGQPLARVDDSAVGARGAADPGRARTVGAVLRGAAADAAGAALSGPARSAARRFTFSRQACSSGSV